ncbi:MAG: hypothetical protein ACK5P7_06835 [Bdellovibrio sp.]|jgi:hypothetical protein
MKNQLTPDEYAQLVDELMKDEPNQKVIRQLMQKQGLPYSNDPILQMSTILKSMDQTLGSANSKVKEPNLV